MVKQQISLLTECCFQSKRTIVNDCVDIEDSASSQQRHDPLDVLRKNRENFEMGLRGPGCADLAGERDLASMDIVLKEDSTPDCSTPYRVNKADQETIRNILQDQKPVGIIIHIRSHCSLALLTRKKQVAGRSLFAPLNLPQIRADGHQASNE